MKFLKTLVAVISLVLTFVPCSNGQNNSYRETGINPANNKTNWTKNPFDHTVFIENKGQFDTAVKSNKKVLFQVMLGKVKAYFTTNGVIYQYDEFPKSGEGEHENIKPIAKYLSTVWEGADTNVRIEAKDEKSYYYTYPKGTSGTIKANIFKRIIYHNIYPGVDIEYLFPKDKTGIKYVVTIGPGANLSNIKLRYETPESTSIDSNGDVIIRSGIGEMTDHAPVSYYQNGENVKITYSLNCNVESFKIENPYNNNKTLVIDPWTTNPNFSGFYNGAYDLDYDKYGNVYVYGSLFPFQLTKFNASGVQQWTFNTSVTTMGNNYGDFALDRTTGTCYLGEGFNATTGVAAQKVNTLGNLVATFPGNSSLWEIWRLKYDAITNQLIIGGGGTNPPNPQAAILDTNLANMTNIVNPLHVADWGHDVCLMSLDPSVGKAYMAVAESTNGPSFNNYLMALPISTLTPPYYKIPDGYNFFESVSINYIGTQDANGMNGMAVSSKWLYMYDGTCLKKRSKSIGILVDSVDINTPTNFISMINWGGLDVDICDNIYLGYQSSINIYDSNFTLLANFPLQDSVYDVVLGQNDTIIYACGNGFVSALHNPISPVTFTNKMTPTCTTACLGTATPGIMICGSSPSIPMTYSWNNGQTNQTATNLCSGTYTVSVDYSNYVFIDTIMVGALAQPVPNVCCDTTIFYGEKIQLGSSGGTIYQWSPSTKLNCNNCPDPIASPTLTTTYTVIATSDSGCSAIDSITIVVQCRPVNVCCDTLITRGENVQLISSGGDSYLWSPSIGLNCDSCINPIASPLQNTTYTVTVNDSGCISFRTLNIDVSCGNVFIPTAFSPNVAHNSILYVRGPCISTMDFNVFDRWGNRIFESQNLNKGWDGTFKGLPMMTGTYVWYLSATLLDGTTIERKGNVALVR